MTYDLSEYEDEEIVDVDFSNQVLSDRSFYHCIFKRCNFTNCHLTSTKFESCTFEECNLTNPTVNQTRLDDASFKNCKLMGLNFYHCDQFVFAVSFGKCVISHCVFNELRMKKAKFLACEIVDCYFQETNLVEASFEDSFFRGTLFHHAHLEKASFCNATGYDIDPRVNHIKKAKFTVPDVLNLLNGFDIDIVG